MSNVVDRLRGQAPWIEQEHYPSIAELMLESAAKIDELQARFSDQSNLIIKQVREIDELQIQVGMLVGTNGDLRAVASTMKRVRDFLKYQANSDGGIVAEMDAVLSKTNEVRDD